MRENSTRRNAYAEHVRAILALFVHSLRDAECAVLSRGNLARSEALGLLSEPLKIILQSGR
jgi:hypothetical protein